YVAPDARLGQGTVICAGVVVQPAAAIGDHVIANTSCTIRHDCVVDDLAHVAPGVVIAGGAMIPAGNLLGISSRVLPLLRVGPWAIVGGGAVVTNDISEGVTAVGVPARSMNS